MFKLTVGSNFFNTKNTVGLFVSALFLSVNLMPTDSIAKTKQKYTPNTQKPENTTSYTKCQHSIINTYCFQKGDRGDYIQNISVLLSELGYYRGKPKKIFDQEIKKSVIKYQKKNKLKSADGIVGFETLFGLCKAHTGKGCTASVDGGWRP